jgi:Zn-dependent protease
MGAADLRRAGIYVICLVLSVTVHEFSHAYAAHKLKDPTPEGQGRLTLNPMAHADPIGTIALPIILALSGSGMLFGWGRPVETQPRYYTRKVTMRGGMALVAFAGPLSNLLMAIVTLALLAVLAKTGVSVGPLLEPIQLFYALNLILFVFNLVPIHPLDGGKVLGWLLGPRYQHVDEFLGRYGWIILIGLVFVPPYLISIILSPVLSLGMTALRAVT